SSAREVFGAVEPSPVTPWRVPHRSPPPVRGRGRGGAQYDRAFQLTPSPPPPRLRGGGQTEPRPPRRLHFGSLLRMNEKTRFMLALITPAALVLVLFQVVPILTGANASFRDWTLHDPKRTWVGLANYIHVLRDQEFLEIVLPNTFGFMFASVALSLVLGLAIALMLNKYFPGRWLVQSFVLLPLMVAPVIAAIMIRWMFNDQFGVVNAALEGLGLAPISWLTQRWTTFFVILLTDVWLWTPWFAL